MAVVLAMIRATVAALLVLLLAHRSPPVPSTSPPSQKPPVMPAPASAGAGRLNTTLAFCRLPGHRSGWCCPADGMWALCRTPATLYEPYPGFSISSRRPAYRT